MTPDNPVSIGPLKIDPALGQYVHVAVWSIEGQTFEISTIGSSIKGSQIVEVKPQTPHPHELHSDFLKAYPDRNKLSSETIEALNDERKRLILLKIVKI